MAPRAAPYSLLAPYAARHSSDVRVDFAPDSKSDPTGTVEAVSRCPLSAGREGRAAPLNAWVHPGNRKGASTDLLQTTGKVQHQIGKTINEHQPKKL